MKNAFVVTLLASSVLLGLPAQAGNSLLLETATEAVALKVAKEVSEGGYKLLAVADLKKMIDAKEDMVLIDAHPRWEHDLAYIAGAKNIGFKSIRSASGKWEDDIEDGHTQDAYRAALGPDQGKKIVIYCGFTKCGRSHNASMWAKQMGYTNIHRVPGGTSAWMDAGYPYKTNLK